MTRTVGSLCTGYGGLELALGLPALWHAEAADAPSRVLKRRWPNVPNLGDLREIDWRHRSVTRPDVMLAGFPCQGASAAGRRLGTADPRWLWPEVARAADALRPAEIFVENVPNLLRVNGGAAFHGILSDLAELGYAARWTVVGACATGLAHHRHRLFLRALPASAARPPAFARWPAAGVMAGGEVTAEPQPKCGGKCPPRLPTPAARDGDGRGEGTEEYWRNRVESTGRTNGVPLGAAVRLLPTPRADARGARVTSADAAARLEEGGRRLTLEERAVLLPTPRATDGTNGGPNQRGARGDLALPSAVQVEHFGQYATAVERHVLITGTLPPAPTEPNANGQPRLSAAFAEWLMDLPAGWVTGELERLPALTAIGNGVVPRQARHAYGLLGGNL